MRCTRLTFWVFEQERALLVSIILVKFRALLEPNSDFIKLSSRQKSSTRTFEAVIIELLLQIDYYAIFPPPLFSGKGKKGKYNDWNNGNGEAKNAKGSGKDKNGYPKKKRTNANWDNGNWNEEASSQNNGYDEQYEAEGDNNEGGVVMKKNENSKKKAKASSSTGEQ